MKKVFAVILFFLYSCTPKQNQWDDVAQRLSVYYGQPFDSVKKHFKITNSCSINSLKLTFYYFADSTNVANKKMSYGQIIKDNSTNNYYIYSWRDLWPSLLPQEVFFKDYQRNDCNNLAAYSFGTTTWRLQKLESVLNNLPTEVRRKINKDVLDTFMQVAFFGRYSLAQGKDTLGINYPSIPSKSKFDSTFNNDYIACREKYYKQIGYQLAGLKSFKALADSLFDKGTLYVYNIPAISPEYMIVIAVNDEFKNDSLATDYNSYWSNEVALFKLKMYTISQ